MKSEDIDITDEQLDWLKNNMRLLSQMNVTAPKAVADKELCAKIFTKLDNGLLSMDGPETNMMIGLMDLNINNLHKCLAHYKKQADRTKFDPYEQRATATLAMITDLKIKFL